MDNTKKVLFVLLILAIVFSVASIFISFSALNLDAPSGKTTGAVIGSGSAGVNLYVEGSSEEGVG